MKPAKPPVSIEEVVEALEFQDDRMIAFVNPESAEVMLVSDEALHAAESPDDALMVDEAELKVAQAVLETPGILRLPSQFEVNEYDMMVRFAAERVDAGEREALQDAIHGKGAFRRFKDLCYSLHLEQDWYAYRDAEYEALAVRWCDAHGLAWTRGKSRRIPPGPT